MPRVLIVYGTTDGHTQKIADVLAHTLRDAGCREEVYDAARVPPDLRLEDYAGVVVAASVHLGAYQRTVRRWVRSRAAVLARMPSVFVSVCLGVLERRPEVQRDLQEILERFVRETGWRPAVVKVVAGALRWSRYGWLKRWMIKRIVAKAGGDTDASRDREYTDWEDLRAFAREFARSHGLVGAAPPAPSAAEPVAR